MGKLEGKEWERKGNVGKGDHRDSIFRKLYLQFFPFLHSKMQFDVEKVLTYAPLAFLIFVFVGAGIVLFQGCTAPLPGFLTATNGPPNRVYGGFLGLGP